MCDPMHENMLNYTKLFCDRMLERANCMPDVTGWSTAARRLLVHNQTSHMNSPSGDLIALSISSHLPPEAVTSPAPLVPVSPLAVDALPHPATSDCRTLLAHGERPDSRETA